MNKSKTEDIKKWINTWEKADSALAKVKLEELRADDYYQKNQAILDEMLQYAFDNSEPRLSSGLVEQQKYFMKLHKQQLSLNQKLEG